jgi:hypothetical protein
MGQHEETHFLRYVSLVLSVGIPGLPRRPNFFEDYDRVMGFWHAQRLIGSAAMELHQLKFRCNNGGGGGMEFQSCKPRYVTHKMNEYHPI